MGASFDRSAHSNQEGDTMRNCLTIAVLAAGLALAGAAHAQSTNSTGTVGTNVGASMKQPMTVTSAIGNVHMQPNATTKLLTTVPQGHKVTMIGSANGGAWAHVIVGSLNGYMDMKQLSKETQ